MVKVLNLNYCFGDDARCPVARDTLEGPFRALVGVLEPESGAGSSRLGRFGLVSVVALFSKQQQQRC